MNDNWYIIFGIGIKFVNFNINIFLILKKGYVCFNVIYWFNIGSNKMFYLNDSIILNLDVEKGFNWYYKGGVGVYLIIGVCFGKR